VREGRQQGGENMGAEDDRQAGEEELDGSPLRSAKGARRRG